MRVYMIKTYYLGLIVLGLCLVVGIMAGSQKILRPVIGPEPISKLETKEKIMALTVNVDWGEENIPPMLDALQKAQVKATFFVSGRWAKEHPVLLKQIAAEGHEIENHGYSHPHPDNISLDENKREILRTEQIVESLTGCKTVYFAPPYGESSGRVLRAADEVGYKTILWTLDTIDWRADSTVELIVQRIVAPKPKAGQIPDKCGAIVLMHPKPNTVKALPIIINSLRQTGFRFVTVAQLLDRKK